MALPTTYVVYLLLKKLADTIIVAQALSGFLGLQELKRSYTAMKTVNTRKKQLYGNEDSKHMNYFKNSV